MWRYHGPGPAKCKSLYETSLLSWAQEKNFGGPGPMGPREKLWGPWALGPSDPSLMALALFFSCIPCSGSLFCPFPTGPGPWPLAFLLCYNPCRPPGLISMGLGLLNANLFMKLPSLLSWAQEKNFGGPGPMGPRKNFGDPGPWALLTLP